MHESEDSELLAQYVRHQSEAAFVALVTRHVHLVYSVALRHVANPHQAEEIAQVVFLLLARKAGSLSPKIVLSGWLYRAARLTAANALRMEKRRERREQEAYMQALKNESDPGIWAQVAPLLDAAMEQLGHRDRDAIILRFFEEKSLKEVGSALGASEGTAQKRVERALKKLRGFFGRRGVALSVVTLSGLLASQSVQAAPAGLAQVIVSTSMAKGAALSSSSLMLMKSTLNVMAWLKIKTAVVVGVSALLVSGVATVTVAKIQEEQREASPDPAVIQLSVLYKQADAEPLSGSPGDQPGMGEGMADEAVAATETEPQDAAAYIARGRSFLARGAYDQALADFSRAIQMDPKAAPAYFGRGRAHKLKGDYRQALADYNRALELKPGMVGTYINRGQVHHLLGDPERAIADYDEAIRRKPRMKISHLNRGVAYVANGEYDQAIADWEFAIKIAPGFSPAYNNLAWLLATCPQASVRDGKRAVVNATKACELSNWKNVNQLDTLAAAYAEAGDFKSAVEWETKALQMVRLGSIDETIAKDRLALYQAHRPYHRDWSRNFLRLRIELVALTLVLLAVFVGGGLFHYFRR